MVVLLAGNIIAGMTNIMLSTDEVMTLYRALQRAMEASEAEAKARGQEPAASPDYNRIQRLFEKVKAVM